MSEIVVPVTQPFWTANVSFSNSAIDSRYVWIKDCEVTAFLTSYGTSKSGKTGICCLCTSTPIVCGAALEEIMSREGMVKESVNCKSKLQEKHYRKQISLAPKIKRHVNYVR